MPPNDVTRRRFLAVSLSVAGGLLISRWLPACSRQPQSTKRFEPYRPVPFVRIDPDGSVALILAKSELGQGVRTALPMILAEELEADWNQVRIEQADYDGTDRYGRQLTGGSNSVRDGWELLRKAGAMARERLIQAAAVKWGVEPAECIARGAAVWHPATARSLAYAELVESAAALPAPVTADELQVRLKSPDEFRLVGRSLARVDLQDIVAGAARYGMDQTVPNMRYAVILRPPGFGTRLTGFDDTAARQVPGVTDVFEIQPQPGSSLVRGGVAVVANDTWAAMQGREALKATWERSATPESTAALTRRMREASARQTRPIDAAGDVETGLAGADRIIEAEYELPFLAHAPMEPLNAVARVADDSCELWLGTQAPEWAAAAVAGAIGLDRERVLIHKPPLVGGGFGRRLNPDYPVEAALVAKRAGVPVKLVWTREDDIQGGIYRAHCRYRMRGGLDARGQPVAWHLHLVNTPVTWTYEPNSDEPEHDEMGGGHVFYEIANRRFDFTPVHSPVPIGWWRAVSQTHNNFAVETFMDELAHAAGADPMVYRQRLLEARDPFEYDSPWGPILVDTHRLLRVLNLAADRAKWGRSLPGGHGMGIACCPYGSTYVAHVAEVEVDNDGRVRVHRVTCAFDCGRIVNPDMVRQQIEGSIVWGLSAALYGEITLSDGEVEQSNFHDYRVLRLSEMPEVQIELVASDEPPSGAGEPAVPSVAPAVGNAIFAATGTRVRQLPIGDLRT